MKIYNENMELISNPNMNKGRLEKKIKTIVFPAIEEVKEQGHFIVKRTYPNGGKDLEWIIDVVGVKAEPAREEQEEYYIYHPYTEEELKKIEEEQKKPTIEQRIETIEKAIALLRKMLGVSN